MKSKLLIAANVVYILLITFLSLVDLSEQEMPKTFEHFDKFVHFCFYFGMNFLLILLVLHKRIRWMFTMTFVAILYSILIELVQMYVSRSFDFWDILANFLGAISALVFIRFTKKELGKFL